MSAPQEEVMAASVENSLPPALVAWRDKKLDSMSYVVGTFFNYLSVDRRGFLRVLSENPSGGVRYDASAVKPRITLEMAMYVISEIFPCQAMISNQARILKAPQEITTAIRNSIRAAIDKRDFLQPDVLVIEPGVEQAIWSYVVNGMNSLSAGQATNSEIQERIATGEINALALRNCSHNYNFNTDTENCAFQTILYIIVTLSDWLETDEIQDIDVITAYRIIVPFDLQQDLDPVENSPYATSIATSIASKNLIPTQNSVGLIASMMAKVGLLVDNPLTEQSRRILNRYLSLCQPV